MEDRAGAGFERGGWALPLFDGEPRPATFLDQVYQRADAFLFGRRTYEIFAGSWGTWPRSGRQPDLDGVEHTAQVRGASTTPFDPEWANTTVLSGDVAAAIRELKAKAGGELQVHGSGVLARWLLDNDLVDEMNLLTYPGGRRPGHAVIPRPGPDKALGLVESRATAKGLTLQVYRPTGRARYATATAD